MVVERLEIAGNRFVQAETYLYYVSTKPGERYDERRLREDFRRLLETGFLDDLSLEAKDGERGKIVVFRVTERKRVNAVEFRGSKALSKTAIENELVRASAWPRLDAFLDPAKVASIEALLRQMLEKKGRPFAKIEHEVEADPAGGRLVFRIADGPEVKVRQIAFSGNHAFSASELRAQLKLIKQPGFLNLGWLGGKGSYEEEKWSGGGANPVGDQRRLQDFYLRHGYVTARIGQPQATYVDERGSTTGPGEKRWLRLVIPLEEGEQYRVGAVKIEGLSVFREEDIRPYFALVPGEVYDESKVRKGLLELRELYGKHGYFQFTGAPQRSPDANSKRVDLVLRLTEDKPYFVGKINFSGNEITRDRVIRRAVFLNEGEVFDASALRKSIRRIDQLGYFEPQQTPPELSLDPKHDDTLDIRFRFKERNGSRYTLGGGVSGTEGVFVNGAVTASNLLGYGETFQLAAQGGSLTRNFLLGYSEPNFTGRAMSAGFDVFSRRLTYRTDASQGLQGYVDERSGVSLLSGLPVGAWGRVAFSYSFQKIDISLRDVEGLEGAPIVKNVYIQDAGRYYESTLGSALVRDTVDDLFWPRKGTRLSARLPLTGGPLGGTLDFVKPGLEAVAHVPHTSRSGASLRAEAAWVLAFGETAEKDPATGENQLPFYQRYFLGGENQIRGYDIRTVGPRDANGQAIGGDKFLLLNAEYYVELLKPLRLYAFFDAGQAFASGQSLSFSDLRFSTGVELRLLLPFLRVPMRLIFAANPNHDEGLPANAFKFAIGTTF